MADKRRLELGDTLAVTRSALADILTALDAAGYTLVGPQVRDNTIVYDQLENAGAVAPRICHGAGAGAISPDTNPERAHLRLHSGSRILEAVSLPASAGPSPAPQERQGMGRCRRGAPAEALAFIGVRACELAAIQIQDRVFLREDYADATYRARRNKAFILAVNCLHPAGTCFCATMGTGPEADSGLRLVPD